MSVWSILSIHMNTGELDYVAEGIKEVVVLFFHLSPLESCLIEPQICAELLHLMSLQTHGSFTQTGSLGLYFI